MKTVIPKKANAKISCRLVANMRPEDIATKVKHHLEASAPPFANVTVTISGFRAQPWVSPKDLPGNAAAAIVLKRVMGAEPLFTRDGGTIPALAYFQQVLGVESSIFAFGLGDHIHAPNERLLESFYHLGREAWVQLLQQLGDSSMKASGSDAGHGGGKDEL
jgi:acetylornithine deacetylase/succinyl-diaminopimelate desuccinylase-like protein